tara:strand:+ start:7868 stop:8980 length:1113 start_codon:yes stop_codon:yes gene_type:complete
MAGVLLGTMALIVVLSVFNGFDEIIQKIYKDIDADIKVEYKEGALFSLEKNTIQQIKEIKEVNFFSEILEYKMLAQYKDYQHIINVKGVDHSFIESTNFKNHLVLGNKEFLGSNFCLVGRGVFNHLSLQLFDFENLLNLSFFNHTDPQKISNLIKSKAFYATGVFATQSDLDYQDIIIDINNLREFLSLDKLCSSLNVHLIANTNIDEVQKKMLNILGPEYLIKNRFQQRPFVNKMIQTEKLMVYIIFTFILLISMLSLIASLTILYIEKQKDIYTLKVLGFNKVDIQNIFLYVGILITSVGVFLGTILGFLFCFFQQKFGLIKLASDSGFFTSAYPIKINLIDIFFIQLIVLTIGAIVSFLVSRNNLFN